MLFSSVEAVEALDPTDTKWTWMDQRIEEEFYAFHKSGVTLQMIDQLMENTSRISFGANLQRFQILGRKVYGPEGDYNPKGLLEKIAELYPVPDVDVVIFTQDIIWNPWDLAGPILATCKDAHGARVILFPEQWWTYWPECIQCVNQASQNIPWKTKKDLLFWRGTANGPDHLKDPHLWTHFERGRVCSWSKERPQDLDAAFTGTYWWMFHSAEQHEAFTAFFPIARRASWEEYLSYKYLLDLDGYVASTPGTAWKLLSNCTVFKRSSRFSLYFSKELKPWVHYVPLVDDLSDMFEKIKWARTHDVEARQIAENGRKFALENLLEDHFYLYFIKC